MNASLELMEARILFKWRREMSDEQHMSNEPRTDEDLEKTQDLQAPGKPRRRSLKRLIAALSLLIGIVVTSGLLFKLRAHTPRPNSIAAVGRPLPAILVPDETGRVWDVSKAGLGAKTVIVFYSTACEVCQRELPNLQPFPSTLGLIMVNEADGSSEEIDRLHLPYTKRFYDRDRVFDRLTPNPGLPTILLVDEQAVLRGAMVGAHSPDALRRRLAEFAQEYARAD
jgi:hypothetical protein